MAILTGRAITLIAGAVILTTAALAQQFGTADQAKAMLTKTVSALKADKAKTLDLINKGEGGFLDRDLYPFCFNISDGKTVALANNNAKQLLGTDVRTNKDDRPFVWPGTLRRGAEAGRSNHRGQLHVSKAGRRQDAGSEVQFRYQSWRSRLRCRLLQIVRSELHDP